MNNQDEDSTKACSETDKVYTNKWWKEEVKVFAEEMYNWGYNCAYIFCTYHWTSYKFNKGKKYIPTETHDNTADEKEIHSNPMDEKERPHTYQVMNFAANLSNKKSSELLHPTLFVTQRKFLVYLRSTHRKTM